LLNVGEGLLKVLQLQADLLLGGLGILDGLDLEGLDGLDLAGDVVGRGLEGGEALLDLGDDGLVLEGRAVVGEVDLGGELAEGRDLAAGVLVALLEGLQGGDGLATEVEGGRDLGPVELERCASLRIGRGEISSARAGCLSHGRSRRPLHRQLTMFRSEEVAIGPRDPRVYSLRPS
jgi:hypothetical protein